LLDQARSTRSDTEGVSLDVEATKMIEYQRSYQATAHMVTILNDLTQSVMDMLSAT
jgi:flagellar hook-associated protein 1 FlgK